MMQDLLPVRREVRRPVQSRIGVGSPPFRTWCGDPSRLCFQIQKSSSTALFAGDENQDYDENSKDFLVYHLCSYLAYPAPGPKPREATVMLCPGFRRNVRGDKLSTSVTYYLDGGLTTHPTIAQIGFFPFGHPYGYPNHKMSEVNAICPPSYVWYIADVDRVVTSTWEGNELPLKPVHGSVRNYLFFDGHVATRKVNPAGGL